MDTIKTLEKALLEEEAAAKSYSEAAESAADPETRLMLQQMAHEEAAHAQRIRERLQVLKMLRS